ncbi:IS110 family transposase [Streptomyces chartreusis]|uniref:IS110 family transposase n=1 Tax=Streptomyces chartreusis TaxID=1969 RepID=UPI00380406BC
MSRIWAGVDIGREHRRSVVINPDGERLLFRRILNDEIGDVLALDTDVLWAVDLSHGGAALLLLSHDQPMVYITGLTVHRASASYRGEGKTDAKDACQARMRRDLGLLRPGDETGVDLRTLTGRRTDVMCDRNRQIDRLRAQLLEIFPASEREMEVTKQGPIIVLTGYQTPAAIRRSGTKRIETWLRNRMVRNAASLARTAVEAAKAEHTALPGEKLAAAMVVRLAKGVIALDEEIAEVDALIEARFREHPHVEVILSLPGMGKQLGAVLLAATGGDMEAFGSANRLACLAPAPRDSGPVSGNLRRPRRFQGGLLNAMYLSASSSLESCPASKPYYAPKRPEGKGHRQALLALARRRINVLWAMICDDACYQATPAVTAAA